MTLVAFAFAAGEAQAGLFQSKPNRLSDQFVDAPGGPYPERRVIDRWRFANHLRSELARQSEGSSSLPLSQGDVAKLRALLPATGRSLTPLTEDGLSPRQLGKFWSGFNKLNINLRRAVLRSFMTQGNSAASVDTHVTEREGGESRRSDNAVPSSGDEDPPSQEREALEVQDGPKYLPLDGWLWPNYTWREPSKEGWKIHVSGPADPEARKPFLDPIITLLYSQKRTFKLLQEGKSTKDYQPGKFLVVYPDDDDDAFTEIATSIARTLTEASPRRGPMPRTVPIGREMKLLDDLPIYCRYGRLRENRPLEKGTPTGRIKVPRKYQESYGTTLPDAALRSGRSVGGLSAEANAELQRDPWAPPWKREKGQQLKSKVTEAYAALETQARSKRALEKAATRERRRITIPPAGDGAESTDRQRPDARESQHSAARESVTLPAPLENPLYQKPLRRFAFTHTDGLNESPRDAQAGDPSAQESSTKMSGQDKVKTKRKGK